MQNERKQMFPLEYRGGKIYYLNVIEIFDLGIGDERQIIIIERLCLNGDCDPSTWCVYHF